MRNYENTKRERITNGTQKKSAYQRARLHKDETALEKVSDGEK